MSEQKTDHEEKPASTPAPPAPVSPATPAPAPVSATPAAAKPAAPPPKVEAPSLPPSAMMSPELKAFLRDKLRSGEEVTVEVNKTVFTGRIFRTMIDEGWLALEHLDGRRKAIMLIEGGRVTSESGQEFPLPGAHGK